MGIDDPINSVSVHFIGGLWGVFATGFCDNQKGIFYKDHGANYFLSYQIIGAACIFAWTAAIALTFFFAMYALDLLRVEKIYEILGMDNSYLDGVTAEDNKVFSKALEKKLVEEENKLK